ncbi:hypothetical protein GCM10027563_13610 [Parasphingorhabdus pacifica]
MPFVIIGAIVLFVGLPVVVIVGGRLYFAMRDDEPEAVPAADVRWTAPAPNDLTIMGSWATDGALVTMDRDHLNAYAAADGVRKWQLTPPTREGAPGSGAFCGMSSTTEDGLGAVSYGTFDPETDHYPQCAGVMVVDLETGQPVQQVDLPVLYERFSDENIQLDIVGDHLVFAQHDMVTAINIADGREVWRHTAVAERGCHIDDFEAGADAVVFPEFCGTVEKESSIVVLDPQTGAVKNSTPLPGVESRPQIISADPPVVLVPPEEWGVGTPEYLVFDESGQRTTTIPATVPEGGLQVFAVNDGGAGNGDPHGRYPLVISNGLLIAATVPSSVNELRETNRIVAFDLETGEQRWSVPLGPKIAGVPFAATENGVLAIHDRTYENPSRVVELSFDDGAIEPVSGEYPKDQFGMISKSELHWKNGTVYGVNMGASNWAPGLFAVR